MSTGLYSHTTRATGTVLTASIYNSDHTNHITNHNPSMIGAYSDTLSQHQLTSDPGGLGTEVSAGSLAVELEQLRFCIKRITGEAQWYIAPDSDLTNPIPANDSITNAKLANMAAGTYKMRVTGSTGDPEDGTAAQATAGLNAVVGDSGSGGTKGLVPAPAAGDAAAGKILSADGTFRSPASQTDMETGTSLLVHTTPANQHHHKSSVKAWGKAGTTGNLIAGYNVASVTDHGTGDITFTWTTAFSSADYAAVGMSSSNTGSGRTAVMDTQAAGSVRLTSWTGGGSLTDPVSHWYVLACGDL